MRLLAGICSTALFAAWPLGSSIVAAQPAPTQTEESSHYENPSPAELPAEAERLSTEARRTMSTMHLEVEPSGADVRMDGTRPEFSPATRTNVSNRRDDAAEPKKTIVQLEDEAASQRKLWSTVVIATSGAVVVAAVVTLGVASTDKAKVEQTPADMTRWSDVAGSYREGTTLFPIGFTLLGIGLAGVAAGVMWKLWPTPLTPDTVVVHVSPGGLVLTGAL